jgi:hypothetical protein
MVWMVPRPRRERAISRGELARWWGIALAEPQALEMGEGEMEMTILDRGID